MKEYLNELIALGVELVEQGFTLGSGGNLSLLEGDTLYISRSGSQLNTLSLDDFLPVALRSPFSPGGGQPRPSIETPMHQAAYLARPEARVVVHCHPVSAIAWAMQGQDLPVCTPDQALYLGAYVPNVPFFLPGTETLAGAVAQSLDQHPTLLLGNHGILVTAETVARARLRTLYIDESARTCLLAAAAGQVRPLKTTEFESIISHYGKKKA